MIFYLFTIVTVLSAASVMDGKNPEHMRYTDIAQLYLPSFVQPEVPKAEVPFKAKTPVEEVFAKWYTVKKLSDYEIRSLALSLLDRSQHMRVGGTYSPLSILAHDLNLFAYQSKKVHERNQHLFAKLNRTDTVFGEAVLARMLGNPTSDMQELCSRQAFLKLLIEDDALFNALQAEVTRIKEKQEDILFNWRSIDDSARQTLADQYFTNSYMQRCNTNEYLNETVQKVIPGAIGVAYSGLTAYGLYGWMRIAQAHARVFGFFNPTTIKILGTTAFCTLYLGYSIYQLKKGFEAAARAGVSVFEHMFNSMAGVSTLVHSTTRIHNLAANCELLRNVLPSAHEVSVEHNEKYERLTQLLATSTFNGAYASIFMFSGRVKVAYLLMQDVKDEFIPLMELVGTIDAYLSIAKVYREYKDKAASYNFVEFIEQETPYVHAQGFWNPMLDATTAVTNDIVLGGESGRAAVVTGSNTGGKSTIAIQGLTTTLLLAQTFGIAPVARLIMTPFDYIATLLKVQDNVLTGHSHFLSEVEYAAKIDAAINQLPESSKAFLAVDELFEGTVAQTGSKALYDFAKKLIDHNQLLFVIATQYQTDPTHLEQATNGVVKNYKVDVIRLSDGTIVRPYKLVAGISEVNIGDDLVQAAFNHQTV